jgi:hypothetical protein
LTRFGIYKPVGTRPPRSKQAPACARPRAGPRRTRSATTRLVHLLETGVEVNVIGG